MKRCISMLGLSLLWPLASCIAQVAAPNEAGVAMGHIHLNVKDVEANKKFWKAMGGTAIKFDDADTLTQDWKLFENGKVKDSHPFTLKRVKT